MWRQPCGQSNISKYGLQLGTQTSWYCKLKQMVGGYILVNLNERERERKKKGNILVD